MENIIMFIEQRKTRDSLYSIILQYNMILCNQVKLFIYTSNVTTNLGRRDCNMKFRDLMMRRVSFNKIFNFLKK